MFLGLTNGLALVLEHFDFGEMGPGDMGVKLKFTRLVFGLGGTGSSKLTRLRVQFVCKLEGMACLVGVGPMFFRGNGLFSIFPVICVSNN